MFYAIQTYSNGSKHFFAGEFDTMEEMQNAIEAWKKQVTPRMAETTVFEINKD